jgi:hypothetical protein
MEVRCSGREAEYTGGEYAYVCGGAAAYGANEAERGVGRPQEDPPSDGDDERVLVGEGEGEDCGGRTRGDPPLVP